MDLLPDEVLCLVLAQLSLSDLMCLEGVCQHFKRALQRLAWNRVDEIHWDRFGELLCDRVNLFDWSEWACTRTNSFVYWGGVLMVKREWLQLEPAVLSSSTMWMRPSAIGRLVSPPPPVHRDQPELLMKLLRRCGHNLKVLVISSSSLYASYNYTLDASTEQTHSITTQKLIRTALHEAPRLESLIVDCPMHSNELLAVMESIRRPLRLKRFCLASDLWRPHDYGPPDYGHNPDPYYQYITSTQFACLLSAMPTLECLDLRGISRPMSHLSFQGVETRCLRQLLLPARWPSKEQFFPSGRQLREIACQFPLLERLSGLTIQADFGEDDEKLTQADLDYFCRNALRLKLLEVVFPSNNAGNLRLGEIPKLEHLRISMDGTTNDHPNRLPVKNLGNFPFMRSFAFRYPFEDVGPIVTALSAIPPFLTRLSIRADSLDGAYLDDNSLRAIISAMGAGRHQLREFQLWKAQKITKFAIEWLIDECTGLWEFEHRFTSLNPGQLIDVIGAALHRRPTTSDDIHKRPRFRLIQYVDHSNMNGLRQKGSTNLHPLVSTEWRFWPYLHGWYVRNYHQLPV